MPQIRGAKLEVGGTIWSGFTFLPLLHMPLFSPAAADGGHEKVFKMPMEVSGQHGIWGLILYSLVLSNIPKH